MKRYEIPDQKYTTRLLNHLPGRHGTIFEQAKVYFYLNVPINEGDFTLYSLLGSNFAISPFRSNTIGSHIAVVFKSTTTQGKTLTANKV